MNIKGSREWCIDWYQPASNKSSVSNPLPFGVTPIYTNIYRLESVDSGKQFGSHR